MYVQTEIAERKEFRVSQDMAIYLQESILGHPAYNKKNSYALKESKQWQLRQRHGQPGGDHWDAR